MPFKQGAVVIADDQFEDSGHDNRPYVIVNNHYHPFYGEQYLCMSLTTNDYGEGVYLHPDYFVDETLREDSYACPWTVFQLSDEQIHKQVAELKPEAVEALITEMFEYLDPETETTHPNSNREANHHPGGTDHDSTDAYAD